MPAPDDSQHWFVMRDLKRPNAKLPAYVQLADAGFNVFTPLATRIVKSGARTLRRLMPVIPDLLFVNTSRALLDPIVARTETLQYRFVKGAPHCRPMTVPAPDMERFIAAVNMSPRVDYLTPAELTPAMLGRTARVVCSGPLNGYECRLVAIPGARRRRVLVTIPGILSAAVEITPDYLQLLPS